MYKHAGMYIYVLERVCDCEYEVLIRTLARPCPDVYVRLRSVGVNVRIGYARTCE